MSEVVFDYTEPLANHRERRRAYLAGVAARTAALGEPWMNFFDPLRSQRSYASTGSSHRTISARRNCRSLSGPPRRSPENGPGPHVIRAHSIHRSDFGSRRTGPRFLRNAQERSRLDELDRLSFYTPDYRPALSEGSRNSPAFSFLRASLKLADWLDATTFLGAQFSCRENREWWWPRR
jgi:hypothetical protein